MRVAYLCAANSIHAVRWVNGLARRGIDVHLISAQQCAEGIEPAVHWRPLGWRAPWAYAFCARELATTLRAIAPDLLHANYASGYGLLARLCGFEPTLLSLWGSDVYDFPTISPLHRWLLRGNLAASTAVASTSRCMARTAAQTFDHPRVFVTPFGVDERRFAPAAAERADGRVVVGTVKTLAATYGIDVLLEAFAIACGRLGATCDLRLEISGDGPQERQLRRRAHDLGVAGRVTFHGAVPHGRVPEMLHRMDIFAALSRQESFGVAALEAAACAKAIVVSDADGLVEVVRHGVNGLVVARDDPRAAADALCRMAVDPALRASLGSAARRHVLEHYTWERSLDLMVDAYRNVIEARHGWRS